LTDELEKCLQLYRSRSDFYEKIDLNIAAVHHDECWYNIRTKILPLAQEASIVSERVIDVENFVIIHERLDTDRFAKLLRDISSDNLEISGLTINFFANQHVPSLRVHDYCQGDSLRAK
jgi:hypothetical protein